MAERVATTKEAIIEASLALIREGGWQVVSARSLASKLGTSTMPIYSAVGSMEKLKQEALVAVSRLMDAAQRVRRTDNEALDLAVGYVAFAREEPRLFRFLMSGQAHMEKLVTEAAASPGFEDSFGATPPIRALFQQLGESGQRNDFVLRSWIFAYGLAELVSGGHVEMDEDDIIRHLTAAGGAFYLYEQNTKEGR
jgi:AcrR family transcriptional regulator